MKCEFCSEPATVHITDMSSGKHRVLHLCQECAEREKGGGAGVQGMEQFVKGLIAAYAGEAAGELARLACPYCGTRFMEFRAQGRLGCPADYEVFRKGLWSMLERIHGCVEHKGKSPRRIAGACGPRSELIRLRRELRTAVEREDYELAAHLRDQIRAQEQAYGPG